MKHNLLLLFLFVSIVFSGFSQSLRLEDADGNDVTNGTLTVQGSPGDTFVKGQVFLHNDSEEDMDIWARKIEHEVVPNSFNTFCWVDFCYDDTVFESQGALSLGPDEASAESDFYGQYFPEGNSGTTIIEYQFFSRADLFETVSITVHYSADATGFNTPVLEKSYVSDPKPNPARDYTIFDFKLPYASQSAKIIVRNMTGSIVAEVPLDPSGKRLRLDTSVLNNGIFLYSFVVNDQVILTKKLVISR